MGTGLGIGGRSDRKKTFPYGFQKEKYCPGAVQKKRREGTTRRAVWGEEPIPGGRALERVAKGGELNGGPLCHVGPPVYLFPAYIDRSVSV